MAGHTVEKKKKPGASGKAREKEEPYPGRPRIPLGKGERGARKEDITGENEARFALWDRRAEGGDEGILMHQHNGRGRNESEGTEFSRQNRKDIGFTATVELKKRVCDGGGDIGLPFKGQKDCHRSS